MAIDGSDPVQLTTGDNTGFMPAWSPDGTRLAFASAVDQEHYGDICVINADGTGLRNLTNSADTAEYVPTWSPDGTQIVYVRWGESVSEIHVMNSDGGKSRMLTSNGEWPKWSADGEQIVFVSDRGSTGTELWTMAPDGSDQTVLTDMDGAPTEPSWSPDGEAIAFVLGTGNIEDSDPVKWNEDIFVMPANGGPARQITSSQGNDHWPPAWSPDGTQLAFTADGKANVGKIVIVDLDSLDIETVSNGDGHDMFPAWRH
ncbi:LpqB family beta-propeller domain-containing protein [Mycetocola zhadangensis]|nr:LpqB family beta-propeller domain-containing protein [Mycetocola zhadangensis]GGE96720.1 hypothetical protein GCM10011313_19630 [Mycetocola zhadangensis]